MVSAMPARVYSLLPLAVVHSFRIVTAELVATAEPRLRFGPLWLSGGFFALESDTEPANTPGWLDREQIYKGTQARRIKINN